MLLGFLFSHDLQSEANEKHRELLAFQSEANEKHRELLAFQSEANEKHGLRIN
jgi:hypothetical protein